MMIKKLENVELNAPSFLDNNTILKSESGTVMHPISIEENGIYLVKCDRGAGSGIDIVLYGRNGKQLDGTSYFGNRYGNLQAYKEVLSFPESDFKTGDYAKITLKDKAVIYSVFDKFINGNIYTYFCLFLDNDNFFHGGNPTCNSEEIEDICKMNQEEVEILLKRIEACATSKKII